MALAVDTSCVGVVSCCVVAESYRVLAVYFYSLVVNTCKCYGNFASLWHCSRFALDTDQWYLL